MTAAQEIRLLLKEASLYLPREAKNLLERIRTALARRDQP